MGRVCRGTTPVPMAQSILTQQDPSIEPESLNNRWVEVFKALGMRFDEYSERSGKALRRAPERDEGLGSEPHEAITRSERRPDEDQRIPYRGTG